MQKKVCGEKKEGRKGPLRGDVDIQVRSLQMDGEARQPARKAQEEYGRRRPVPRVPSQIPESWIQMAER